MDWNENWYKNSLEWGEQYDGHFGFVGGHFESNMAAEISTLSDFNEIWFLDIF